MTKTKTTTPEFHDWERRVHDWVHHYTCLPLAKFTATPRGLMEMWREGVGAEDAAKEIIHYG